MAVMRRAHLFAVARQILIRIALEFLQTRNGTEMIIVPMMPVRSFSRCGIDRHAANRVDRCGCRDERQFHDSSVRSAGWSPEISRLRLKADSAAYVPEVNENGATRMIVSVRPASRPTRLSSFTSRSQIRGWDLRIAPYAFAGLGRSHELSRGAEHKFELGPGVAGAHRMGNAVRFAPMIRHPLPDARVRGVDRIRFVYNIRRRINHRLAKSLRAGRLWARRWRLRRHDDARTARR